VVGEERMLVVCAADHRLAKVRARKTDLRDERWIGFPVARGRESFGYVLSRQLAAAGLNDAKVSVIDILTAQKRLVEAGFGIALVPESSVRDELRLGSLAEIDAPSIRTSIPIALIHRRKGYLNTAARTLIDLLDRRAGSPAKK